MEEETGPGAGQPAADLVDHQLVVGPLQPILMCLGSVAAIFLDLAADRCVAFRWKMPYFSWTGVLLLLRNFSALHVARSAEAAYDREALCRPRGRASASRRSDIQRRLR